MTTMTMGANIPITASALKAVLTWDSSGAVDVDASALLLSDAGRVRDDQDFIFYNQPRHETSSVQHSGKIGGTDTLEIRMSGIEGAVDRVVLAASADGGTFGQVTGLALRLVDAASGAEIAVFPMTAAAETAFVCGELYRRNGQWKFRAIGQGYSSGLAGLATDFGISIDADPEPTVQTTSVAAPAPLATPVVGSPTVVNLDKGRVSLRKNDRVSLVKSGAPALTKVTMGLGWDPARGKRNIDLDASVIAFDASAKKLEMVWFGHLKAFSGALRHMGDNRTGKGDGDDEQIKVDLSQLPANVAHLVFTINSFRGHKFTDIERAFCRLVDDQSRAELVRFDLSEAQSRTAVLMVSLSRTQNGTWEMRALGQYLDGRTVRALVDPAAQAVRRL
jgi:stress response protein SCP2